jgi:hypothetical protein
MNAININLNQTQPFICACGSEQFENFVFLRIIPAIISPTMRPELLPVPAFRCIKCKKPVQFVPKKPEN